MSYSRQSMSATLSTQQQLSPAKDAKLAEKTEPCLSHTDILMRKYERARYLRKRARHFQHCLQVRPFDRHAILSLIDITYEQNDHQAAVQVISKAITLGVNDPSPYYIKLGKCYFRRWHKDKTKDDLIPALAAYKDAIRDSIVERGAQPIPHFEMITILVRLGQHQEAFDMLGAVSTLFRNDTDWMILSQYIIAQNLLLIGKVPEAHRLYQQLVLISKTTEVDPGPDNIVMVTTRMNNFIMSLETARILQRMGKQKLAFQL